MLYRINRRGAFAQTATAHPYSSWALMAFCARLNRYFRFEARRGLSKRHLVTALMCYLIRADYGMRLGAGRLGKPGQRSFFRIGSVSDSEVNSRCRLASLDSLGEMSWLELIGDF